MKLESVKGIILSETNYHESSKILNILTEEYGMIGVISKGCRNMKSKLRGVSRKLIYATFHISYKEQGLSTLISVDLIASFSKIVMDLEKVSYASFLIDLVQQAVKQSEEKEIFFLLRDTLLKMEEGLSPLVLTNILQLKLLDYLGVHPSIDCCSVCGKTTNIVSLSASSGGYLCKDCYTNEGIVREKTIQMIRMYYYVEIKNITKLEVSEEVSKEINQFLDDYYDRYTGLYLKSKHFMERIQRFQSMTG